MIQHLPFKAHANSSAEFVPRGTYRRGSIPIAQGWCRVVAVQWQSPEVTRAYVAASHGCTFCHNMSQGVSHAKPCRRIASPKGAALPLRINTNSRRLRACRSGANTKTALGSRFRSGFSRSPVPPRLRLRTPNDTFPRDLPPSNPIDDRLATPTAFCVPPSLAT